MIADIFYPIFTVRIIVLPRYIQKNCLQFSLSPRHCPGPPGGLTAPPRPPAAIVFGLAKSRCTHIFFVLSPVYYSMREGVDDNPQYL